jgi:hypothetical protein
MTTTSKESLYSQPYGFPLDHDASVLTSWKDIAKFLGKGVRTVQRWEKELGLPVRRPKQARKSAVLAIPSEIDGWVRSQRFSDGQSESDDKAALLRRIEELRLENLELRQQVQLLCAKSA